MTEYIPSTRRPKIICRRVSNLHSVHLNHQLFIRLSVWHVVRTKRNLPGRWDRCEWIQRVRQGNQQVRDFLKIFERESGYILFNISQVLEFIGRLGTFMFSRRFMSSRVRKKRSPVLVYHVQR